jgi:hypothetical protein
MNLEIKLGFQSLVYKYLVHDVTLHHAGVFGNSQCFVIHSGNMNISLFRCILHCKLITTFQRGKVSSTVAINS